MLAGVISFLTQFDRGSGFPVPQTATICTRTEITPNCSQAVFQVTDIGDFQRAVAASRCVMVRIEHRNFLGGPGLLTHDAPGAFKRDDECESERTARSDASGHDGPSRDRKRWSLSVQPSAMGTKVIDWRPSEQLSWD